MSLLIVLGLVAFGLRANAKEMNPTCTPRETIPKNGSSTTMNCSFVGDIEHFDIIVQLYPLDSSSPEHVVDCYSEDAGSHTCKIRKQGVSFSLIPGKEQSVGILHISHVTQQSAGQYVCQTVGMLGNQMCNPCVLQVAEFQDAKLTADQNGAANNNKNMAPEKPETDQTSPLSPGVIGGAIVGAVCVLGLLVAGGFIISRKRNGRNSSQKNPIYNPVSTNPAVTV